ncbi:MAG: ribbon-helix-helix protein, CopG family [Firmicutes bacterium]|nr:ribbon-helix-helix protein, CopG family [Bacillota bacterium]
MKNETVRIRIRLTEEEKEKLERDAALCGLSQAEYIRQICKGKKPQPQPVLTFGTCWRNCTTSTAACKNVCASCPKPPRSAVGLRR